jgi:hypothetical protein
LYSFFVLKKYKGKIVFQRKKNIFFKGKNFLKAKKKFCRLTFRIIEQIPKVLRFQIRRSIFVLFLALFEQSFGVSKRFSGISFFLRFLRSSAFPPALAGAIRPPIALEATVALLVEI